MEIRELRPETFDVATENATPLAGDELAAALCQCLDDNKAENIVSIDLAGKSALFDHMLIATGRSQRHVGAIADHLVKRLKELGHGRAKVEGMPQCDWVLVDAGDVIIHVMRPEMRDLYPLERLWSDPSPVPQGPSTTH